MLEDFHQLYRVLLAPSNIFTGIPYATQEGPY